MRNNLSFYSLKERIFLVKTFYQSDSDVICAKNKFILEYGPQEDAPTDSLIFEVINLFEETGSVREIPEIPEFFTEERKDTFIIEEINVDEPEIKQETEDCEDANSFILPMADDVPEKISETTMKQEEAPKSCPKRTIRDPNRVRYECEICQKRLASMRGMRNHMLRHTDTKEVLCKYCKMMIQNGRELKKHIKEQHTKEVQEEKPSTTCHICSKTFKFASILQSHLITHSEERAQICDVCGKVFKTKNSLRVHKKSLHTAEKPYKCPYPNCEKAFGAKNSYVIHERCHTGDRPYFCETCGKNFTDRASLRVHNRQHTGENPYVCELCGKATKQKQNLKSHMKHFHKIDNVFKKTKKPGRPGKVTNKEK